MSSDDVDRYLDRVRQFVGSAGFAPVDPTVALPEIRRRARRRSQRRRAALVSVVSASAAAVLLAVGLMAGPDHPATQTATAAPPTLPATAGPVPHTVPSPADSNPAHVPTPRPSGPSPSHISPVASTVVPQHEPSPASGNSPNTTQTATSPPATYQIPAQVYPVVSSLSPAKGPVAGGITVLIEGGGFDTATMVKFGPYQATQFLVDNSHEIKATAPPGRTGETEPVIVYTSLGPSSTAPGDRFTWEPAPTVSQVSPPTGSSSGGTQVTISGANLGDTELVMFGSRSASFRVVSPTEVVVAAPPGTEGTTVPVTVTTPGGTSTPAPATGFTYV